MLAGLIFTKSAATASLTTRSSSRRSNGTSRSSIGARRLPEGVRARVQHTSKAAMTSTV
jgi:hypothetical protein